MNNQVNRTGGKRIKDEMFVTTRRHMWYRSKLGFKHGEARSRTMVAITEVKAHTRAWVKEKRCMDIYDTVWFIFFGTKRLSCGYAGSIVRVISWDHSSKKCESNGYIYVNVNCMFSWGNHDREWEAYDLLWPLAPPPETLKVSMIMKKKRKTVRCCIWRYCGQL